MKKLELKHLAPYLPYGLNIENSIGKVIELGFSDVPYHLKRGLKPILRPLSDLFNDDFDLFRSSLSYNSRTIVLMQNDLYYDLVYSIPYFDFIKLLENHFDVFNLIPNGLAIDINTLEL